MSKRSLERKWERELEAWRKNRPERVYFVYDGRAALGDTDRAIVLVTADSLDEAIKDRESFPDSVVYSYATGGEYLTDGRLEVTLDGLVLSRI